MSDDTGKTETQLRIEKMDRAAEALLRLIENEKTSEQQKGRLFAQVMAWEKVRKTLVPSDDGGKIKEMAHGLKNGKRDRSTDLERKRVRDGHAIEKIIRDLPSFDRGTRGDPATPERTSGSADSNDRSPRVDIPGDESINVDVAGNSPVI